MSDFTFGRKKAGTSTFSSPSLVSPHTPTLANPVRGFGLPTNNVIQTQTPESAEQQAAQAADERSKLLRALEQPSFGHHISRYALRRPQAKLTVGEPGDKYEQEADWMANQVMRMVVPDKPNADGVQPVEDTLQRKCTACEEEEQVQRSSDSVVSTPIALEPQPTPEIQREPNGMPPKQGTTQITKNNATITASGKNITEAITNLTSQGKGEAASVTCTPGWDSNTYQVDDNPDPIVYEANVQVTETKSMPVWTELNQQCEPVRKEWARFYTALDTHENGHISIDEKAFRNLHTKLLGKKKADANTTFNDTVTKADTDNNAYDTTTQHGLNQGTKVSPVQCGLEKVPQNQDESGAEPLDQDVPNPAPAVQTKFSTSYRERQADGVPQVQPDLESRLNASQGGGSLLSEEVRSFMEPRFGADFSQVRVHTGSEAVQMNQELGAQAFTHGSDVYFGAGKSPGNNELMAHELTHVVQQTGGVQTKQVSEQTTVQLKFSASENNISAVSEPGIQKWSWEEAASETACFLLSDEQIYTLFSEFYFKNQPNARQHLIHYVTGGGKPYLENVQELFVANPRVRSRIAKLINDQIGGEMIASGSTIEGSIIGKGVDDGGSPPIRQSDYDSEDWRNANGNIDQVDWRLIGTYDPADYNKFQITIIDPYTWHPHERRPTQCLHEAFERLKSKTAADYITTGTAEVILPPVNQSPDLPIESEY